MKTFYFIRHGETELNRQGIIQGSGVDSRLNDTGMHQGRRFFNYYKNECFDYVICSSLRRSYETIEPFLSTHHLPYEKTALINEISWGIHEGKSGNPQLRIDYKTLINAWNRGVFDSKFEGGESATELSARLSRFMDYIISLPYDRILVCTHGRALRCLMCLIEQKHLREMENYEHANTGLYLVTYNANEWSVLKHNDSSHLIKR